MFPPTIPKINTMSSDEEDLDLNDDTTSQMESIADDMMDIEGL